MEERDNVLLRRPAVATVALLSALLVPVVAVPYALTRRRITHLTHQIDRLVAANAELRDVVSKLARDIALRKEELARATSILERSKNEMSLLRRDISQAQTQLNSFQSAARAELHTLLGDAKSARQALPASASSAQPVSATDASSLRNRLDLFPQLGLSLADIAAFMHQVELHQGVPSSSIHDHGVDRLRTLALRLQISATAHKS